MARPVIYYSSVSLTLAGAFLLTMAVLSRMLPALSPEWKRVASVAFYLLVGCGGLVLTFSSRASRAVKRFIDHNFYANRYDYRREWERVSSSITPTARPEDICRQIETLVRLVFDAQRTAVYVRDEPVAGFRRLHGPPAMPATIDAGNPLVVHLQRTLEPLSFREVEFDLDLVPIGAENRDAVRAIDAAVVAPLAIGDRVDGLLWVSGKRNDEEYSTEDVDFLATMARQLAAALGFARQATLVAEARQLESLDRLSTHVLHDIKNHVSGLSLVVENARRHLSNPEFQRDALAVVERTVSNLKELMNQVASVVRTPEIEAKPCAVRPLMLEAASGAGLTLGGDGALRFEFDCDVDRPVPLDRAQMLRVVTNLLTNARGSGRRSGDDRARGRDREGAGPPFGDSGSSCVTPAWE